MRPGEEARIKLDAYPHIGFCARVTAISPGTGSSLLAAAGGERHGQLGEGHPARALCAWTSASRRTSTLAAGLSATADRRHRPPPPPVRRRSDPVTRTQRMIAGAAAAALLAGLHRGPELPPARRAVRRQLCHARRRRQARARPRGDRREGGERLVDAVPLAGDGPGGARGRRRQSDARGGPGQAGSRARGGEGGERPADGRRQRRRREREAEPRRLLRRRLLQDHPRLSELPDQPGVQPLFDRRDGILQPRPVRRRAAARRVAQGQRRGAGARAGRGLPDADRSGGRSGLHHRRRQPADGRAERHVAKDQVRSGHGQAGARRRRRLATPTWPGSKASWRRTSR